MIVLGLAAGCTSSQPASPELQARCTKMYRLWMKYEAAENPSPIAQRARVELASYRCQTARYEEGIPQLEKILRRDLIPVPR